MTNGHPAAGRSPSGIDRLKVTSVVPTGAGGPAGVAVIDRQWDDTWYLGAAIAKRFGDSALLTMGLKYDSSPVDSKDRQTSLPVDEQIRFAFGALHDLSDKTTLGLSFEYVNLGKADVNQNTVKGQYSQNAMYLFALNLNWKQLPWSGKLTF